MDKLIGVNFGLYLPDEIKEGLKFKFSQILSIIKIYNLETGNFLWMNEKLNNLGLNTFIRKGGKDIYYLIDFFVKNFHFILKISKWNVNELAYYLLSANDFSEKTNRIIDLPGSYQVNIELASTVAFTLTSVHEKDVVIIVQEFNDSVNYTDFLQFLSEEKQGLPVNLIRSVWEFLNKNGFVIDFMPKNFHITFNQEKKIYQLEYLDYIFSVDSMIKEEANKIAEEIENEYYRQDKFRIL